MSEEPTLEQIYKDIKEFAQKFSEPPILIDVKDDELREGLIKHLSDSGRDLSNIVIHHPILPGRNIFREKFNEATLIITESFEPRVHHSVSTIPHPVFFDDEYKCSEHCYGIDMAKDRTDKSVVTIINRYAESTVEINKQDRNKKKRARRARKGK